MAVNINDETEANARYGRLSCLVMKEGTRVLQEYITSHLPGNVNLASAISKNKAKFKDLVKQRKMTAAQFEILFPQSGSDASQDELDITLWILIGRNLVSDTHIKPNDWKTHPSEDKKKPGHDFVRLREARNKLAHMSVPELDYAMFCEIWGNISGALLRLGSTKEKIDNYYKQDLDPETTRKIVLEMREQSLEELFHVYIREAESKAYMKKSVITISVIAICTVIAIVVPVVMLLQPEKPCSSFQQAFHTSENEVTYMPRYAWRAKSPIPRPDNKHLMLPVPFVIFTDTANVERCQVSTDCCATMRTLQKAMMDLGFSDIAYSYVIGNDGIVYEGRGGDVQPAASIPYNRRSLIIAFDGSYYTGKPSIDAMNAAYGFLIYLLEDGLVTNNFTIYAMCQVDKKTPCSPGPEIYNVMQKWHQKKWSWREAKNGSTCYNASNAC